MEKKRIDQLLVEKELAPSREKAKTLILAKRVLVNNNPDIKPGQLVPIDAEIRIRGEDKLYVSRGGIKLAAALDTFKIEVAKKVALDIGASTGGFSDVLLQRDIEKIYAVDVGHNQLDWKIRQNPKVIVLEKLNARYLTFDQIGQKVDMIVVDVSFISLDKILPALLQFSNSETDWITLIKPQFEVGKEKVGKNGIVSSEEDRIQAVTRLTEFAETLGLIRAGLIESPITGVQGNKEFLAHWKQIS